MSFWDRVVEQRIQEAQERGDFSNLPGRGRPLPLTQENPFIPPHLRLAYKVLENAGVAVEWVEDLKFINRQLDEMRHGMDRHAAWHRQAVRRNQGNPCLLARIAADHACWRVKLAQQVDEINQRIALYNLRVPIARLQRPPLSVAEEILRLDTLCGLSPERPDRIGAERSDHEHPTDTGP